MKVLWSCCGADELFAEGCQRGIHRCSWLHWQGQPIRLQQREIFLPTLPTQDLPGCTRLRNDRLSGPVVRATATISAIPPYCTLRGIECLNMAKLDAVPLALACALEVRYPCKRGVSQQYLGDTICKQGQNACDTPSAILSRKDIARYGGYLALAAKITDSMSYEWLMWSLMPWKPHDSTNSVETRKRCWADLMSSWSKLGKRSRSDG